MTIANELFADNIGEIVLTGALVRIDLVSLSATRKDDAGAPAREFRQRVVMPVDGFVHSFSLMVQVMQQLEKHGLVTRNAAPPQNAEALAVASATSFAGGTSAAGDTSTVVGTVVATGTTAPPQAAPVGVKSPNFK